ncbi:unknown [Ruminococcus sp. CAG:579]|nr:unknown [Ruminococcus sp. CAG:579]
MNIIAPPLSFIARLPVTAPNAAAAANTASSAQPRVSQQITRYTAAPKASAMSLLLPIRSTMPRSFAGISASIAFQTGLMFIAVIMMKSIGRVTIVNFTEPPINCITFISTIDMSSALLIISLVSLRSKGTILRES